MPVLAKLTAVVIDCADPAALAEFYRKVTGWEVTDKEGDFAALGDGGPVRICFQRVEGHHAPAWPGAAARAHLDLAVADLDGAVGELLAAGASKPDFQPGGGDFQPGGGAWVVLTDPEGHPFCLSAGA